MKKITLLGLLLLPLISLSQNWNQIGNTVNSAVPNDALGNSVSISGDGNIMAAGSMYYERKGAVSIYEHVNNNWVRIGNMLVGEADDDQFGKTVSLSKDGSVIAIGAPYNGAGGHEAGHVRVFKYDSGSWVQLGGDIDGLGTQEYFGRSISLSDDGLTIAIGSFASRPVTNAGEVRVFRYISGAWVQLGNSINGLEAWDNCGASLRLNSAGDKLVVGSQNAGVPNVGSGYVRVFNYDGGSWQQIGDTIHGHGHGSSFGGACDINKTGDIVAMGGEWAQKDGKRLGCVMVYKNVSGTWTKIGEDLYGDEGSSYFGGALALNDAGNALVVSARGNNSHTGKVNVYLNNSGAWNKVGNDLIGSEQYTNFGYKVDMNASGSSIAVAILGKNSIGSIRVFGNVTLSITDNTFGEKLVVSPNPSFGNSTINLGKSYKDVRVRITNVLGKEVKRMSYKMVSSISLDTTTHVPGVYIINVTSGTHKASIKLLVK